MFNKNLFKSFVTFASVSLALSGLLSVSAQEDNVLKIASHMPPMTDIVEIAADVIEEPYSIELVEVSDNIQYNEAVFNDEAFGSFAQHLPFMEMFNEEREADLVAIQPVYNAVVGFYSPVYESMEDIEEGAEVAIPSDPTNEARALFVLEQNDLIELDDEAGLFPTVDDITENPYNFEFTSVDLLNLTGAYEDGVELVFNYPTYIASIDLKPEDALFLEKDDENTFAIILSVREGNKDSEAAKALQKAFSSPEVREFVDKLAEEGHLEPAFDSKDNEDDEDDEDDQNEEASDDQDDSSEEAE
ncbi:MetQ/NlpA family ABC transporter substrate-binding protein [Facklamia sp. P12932]|uniref:MetQ/NlpA family ABC transporter substrate-binding protein n=1 Tax=Facklamia sp. P12932 TaxID=3421947 RepID=UPI003D17BC2B